MDYLQRLLVFSSSMRPPSMIIRRRTHSEPSVLQDTSSFLFLLFFRSADVG